MKKEEGTERNDEFDAVAAMTWENGIGHLPGSNLKVWSGDGTINVTILVLHSV